eukprot:TRINITY_DN14382_c0_g1_i1.p1 TRINITY_DN14382_c0_g1~~TRINITY_DN14382_c0_g1_i1.p1  ORF type:complete len:348 (-),score=45.48 TRINITY_DN14382_c0_g1_i1:83-1126(-)
MAQARPRPSGVVKRPVTANRASKKDDDETVVGINKLSKSFANSCVAAGFKAAEFAPITKIFQRHIEERKPIKQMVLSQDVPQEILPLFFRSLRQLRCETMKSLCFWRSDIGDPGIEALSRSLCYFPNLTRLDLMGCKLKPSGCEALAQGMLHPIAPNILTLNLDHNPIGSEGMRHLAHALKQHRTLSQLQLAFCDMDAAAGRSLAEVLASPTTVLQQLTVEGNQLGGEGVIFLAEGLAANHTVNILSLANNQFSGEEPVLRALAQAFLANTKLAYINLDVNPIGDQGALFFFEALQTAQHIKQFIITPFINREIFQKLVHFFSPPKEEKPKAAKKVVKKKSSSKSKS